ncbi:MAG: PEP-CTERM sorting domain-containing protein, partial [Fimbriimonas sp.]
DSYEFQQVSSTPEPASMMALGVVAVALVRRRKRS